jgi:hypothetical protein
MKKLICGSIAAICLILLFLPVAGSSQEPSPSPSPRQTRERRGRLHVVVTGGARPVSGADVMVRSGDGDFSESTNTNSQGAAAMSNVPFGSIKVQVAAQGWKTSGRQYDFKEGTSIQVNLEPDQREKPPEGSPTPTR